MTTSAPTVHLEVEGTRATVVLARPAVRNALSEEMDVSLHEALAAADHDPHVRVIVLRSSSTDWFCAGGDLTELDRPRRRGVGRGGGLTGFDGPLLQLTKPLLAVVTGPAIGMGCELALCADLIIAAENAWFAIPETRRGLLGGPGVLHRALRQLPDRIAMGMVLTGDPLSASDAARYGLVNECVALGALDATVDRWVQRIARSSPLAVAAVLEASRSGARLDLETALASRYPRIEAYRWAADFREARSAVAERREPVWEGV